MNSSDDNIFIQARESERKYHDELYNNTTLFSKGSWLEKPVSLVINSFKSQLEHSNTDVNVLDLGCGVGRNCIPIAEMIKNIGSVTCVDLLDSALSNLKKYAKEYRVENVIIPVLADVQDYMIAKNRYDFIFSVSCIEHVPNVKTLEQVIKRMVRGTKLNGSNCLMMYSNVNWIDKLTNKNVQPLIELNLNTKNALIMLKKLYKGWDLKELSVKPWKAVMSQNNREILFKTDCVCLVARKTKNS